MKREKLRVFLWVIKKNQLTIIMINQDNFTSLGFEETKNMFSKHFEEGNFYLKADFNKQKLEYPERLKVWGEFTTNFSSNENFVVFECVHRLLDKGYQPEHIELEPKWDLGGGVFVNWSSRSFMRQYQ